MTQSYDSAQPQLLSSVVMPGRGREGPATATKVQREVPAGMQSFYRRFEGSEFTQGPTADSRSDVGIGRRSGSVSVEIRRANPAGQSTGSGGALTCVA